MTAIRLEDIKPEEIGFDCDGVIYPFFKPFVDYFNKKTGSKFNATEIKTYDITCLNHSGQRAMDYIVPFHKDPEWGFAVKPYRSSVELFDMFHWAGIESKIITKRHPEVEHETMKCFSRDFGGKVPLKNIHMTGYEKPVKRTKSQIMSELGLKLIVEDCYANAVDAINAGFLAIIINHHYNQNGSSEVPYEDHEGIFRPDKDDNGLLAIIEMVPSLKRIFS